MEFSSGGAGECLGGTLGSQMSEPVGSEPSASLEVALLCGSLKKTLLKKRVDVFGPEAFPPCTGCARWDPIFTRLWGIRPSWDALDKGLSEAA